MDRVVFYSNPRWERHRNPPERNKQEIPIYEGPDLISRLPDDVLGAVLTLLKPQEGARTAALSRRWRHVWRTAAPLNLDDDGGLRGVMCEEDRIRVISQILAAAAHPSGRRPVVRRLATTRINLRLNIRIYDDWLRSPAFDALQELVLRYTDMGANPAALPASALRFSASLRVLDLRACSISTTTIPAAAALALPCLTDLSLTHVEIAEDLLHRMVSGCPGIESLVLRFNTGHGRLRLPLPRLRCLAVAVCPMPHIKCLADVVVGDAASLERLLVHVGERGPSVRVLGARNLKMIGYLATCLPIVAINDTLIFKNMVPVSLPERFSTIKILGLQMPELPNLDVVLAYLRCFPCLEKLTIKFFKMNSWKTTSPDDAVNCDASAPVECLDHSLKIIVLQVYRGLKAQVDFAKFFVERAKILEVMKFCVTHSCTPKWREEHCRQLNIENRASICAMFSFMLQRELPAISWMDGLLSREDPFIECVG